MSALDMFPETRVDPGLDIDRRYTTRETMDLCMRLAGVDAWDLDVAAVISVDAGPAHLQCASALGACRRGRQEACDAGSDCRCRHERREPPRGRAARGGLMMLQVDPSRAIVFEPKTD